MASAIASTSRTLQETLETEYPLLDSSLLAAFISDLPSGTDSSHDSLESLHQTLTQLSLGAQAGSDVPVSELPDHSALGSDERLGSENSASISLPDDASPSASGASSTSTSATSAASCTSSLEFLCILFPQLSRALISQALRESSDPHDPPDEPNLSAVLDHLLTLEYIQDLAERGLEDETEVDSGVWLTATAHGKHGTAAPKSKSRARTHTVPIVDIRQRQHTPRTPVADLAAPPRSSPADPWMRLTSLATRLSELLPPTPPGFFISHFHAPAAQAPNSRAGWRGEGDALRDALSALAAQTTTPVDEAAVEVVHDVMFDPEAEEFALLDAEQRTKLATDARLCITAAHGDSNTAVDLMWLLRELDDAFSQGDGVAHAIEPFSSGSRAAAPVRITAPSRVGAPGFAVPAYPPPVPPPPLSQKHPPGAHSARADRGWKLVEPRRPAPAPLAHPHAEFIPAYANRNPRTRRPMKSSRNQFGMGGKSDADELDFHTVDWYKARAGEVQKQRNEALREATRHWQGGNAKSRGGEVALYYAEKARELREQQKQWSLGAARVMIEEKRTTSAELDLHGLTVAEACVIVTETLAATPPTPTCPLKVITGRGRHSAGRVGVLGPAVREMLRNSGWRVGAWDGGLIVRGRT